VQALRFGGHSFHPPLGFEQFRPRPPQRLVILRTGSAAADGHLPYAFPVNAARRT